MFKAFVSLGWSMGRMRRNFDWYSPLYSPCDTAIAREWQNDQDAARSGNRADPQSRSSYLQSSFTHLQPRSVLERAFVEAIRDDSTYRTTLFSCFCTSRCEVKALILCKLFVSRFSRGWINPRHSPPSKW